MYHLRQTVCNKKRLGRAGRPFSGYALGSLRTR